MKLIKIQECCCPAMCRLRLLCTTKPTKNQFIDGMQPFLSSMMMQRGVNQSVPGQIHGHPSSSPFSRCNRSSFLDKTWNGSFPIKSGFDIQGECGSKTLEADGWRLSARIMQSQTKASSHQAKECLSITVTVDAGNVHCFLETSQQSKVLDFIGIWLGFQSVLHSRRKR